MTHFSFLVRVLVCSSLLCVWGQVFPQSKKARKLTRRDVVIQHDRPSIYLCAEKSSQNDNAVWVRVANNTIWTIRFPADKQATQQRLLKLSNGKLIGGLTNQSVAFPRYEFESGAREARKGDPLWSDFGTASWLPSNTSALFSVPVSQFDWGTLYLEYKYEWEFTGAIADESHAPVHRVYFDIASLQDLATRLCR
jgi:hypothetical protein